MPAFSKQSLARLLECHDDLKNIFMEIIKYYDITIVCGHRNEHDQNYYHSVGLSKLKFPESKHNSMPSMAIDVQPYPMPVDNNKPFYYLAGYVDATADRLYRDGVITHKIRWGGDWDCDRKFDKQMFNDLYHFELVKP